jgi:hypothetical protein
MKRKGSVGNLGRPKGSTFLGYFRVGPEREERMDYGPLMERRASCEQILCIKKVLLGTENSCYNAKKVIRSPKEALMDDSVTGRPPAKPIQESSQAIYQEGNSQAQLPIEALSMDRLIAETNQRPIYVLFDRHDTKKDSGKEPKDTDFKRFGGVGVVPQPLSPFSPSTNLRRSVATPRMLSEAHFLPRYRQYSTTVTNNKKISSSTSNPKSTVIDKRMDRLAKQDHSQKIRDRSLRRTSNVKSKVSLMLSCPSFFKALSQKRGPAPSADLTNQLRQSFMTNKSKKMLANRPKIDIADLLLQKGKIIELKKEKLMRQSLPAFRPNADNLKRSSKSPVRVHGDLDVFQRLALSTFVREARRKSGDIDYRRQSAYLPLKAAGVSGWPTTVSTKMPSTSFENLNKITLKSQGSDRFFVFHSKYSETAHTGKPGKGDWQPDNPSPLARASANRGLPASDDSVYQKNKYWLMKREGKLAQIRKENEGKDLVGCTFRPAIGQRPTRNASRGNTQANKENGQLPSHPKFSLKTPDRYVDDILKSAGLFLRSGG